MKRYIYKIFRCQVPNAKCQVVETWRAMFSTLSAIVIGTTLATIVLCGCQEEPGMKANTEEEFSEVTIRVPFGDNGAKFANTRGDGDSTAPVVNPEGEIKNIYLFVVSDINNTSNFEILKLTEPHQSTDGSNTYLDYKTQLETGNYKFYVVANFDDYLFLPVPKIVSTEDQLKDLVNDFTTDKELIPGNLPMACMKTLVNNSPSNNMVYIEKGKPITVTAPLEFVCSKIRYTILFDARKDGFSEGFGEKRIRFLVSDDDLPYVKNFGAENEYAGFTDVTDQYLKDADFSGNSNDWSGTRFTDHSDGVAEHFNRIFDTYQELNNMPAGIYNLEAQGFYRNGDRATAWTRYLFRNEQLLAKLYIKDVRKDQITETSFMSLYAENYGNSPYTAYPNGYPNGTSDANNAFNTDGTYNGNAVTYTLESAGQLQIGIRKTGTQINDWTCFDNFKLNYKPLQKNNSSLQKTIPLDRFTFTWEPMQNPTYPTSATDELKRYVGSDEEWNDLGYKAWQGLIYLPENTASNLDDRTILHFPYSFGDENKRRGEKTLILFGENGDSNPTHDRNDSKVTHGLERGMMYDIVIKVVKSEIEEDQFTLNVRVKDWKYNPEESTW